ncbi:NAD-dependent epimerase/dehydratase family protein [Sphingomonas sp.]|jgi:UDP-glucose 4-epimerase|uniref:NAD-dependent epimerase/dehydratase family protein n=1 Tax=Sphingomonas sp. TaxID=28214 RepID=UPI002ED8EBCA
MRILLIGGSGFIGSRFASAAAAAGHEVTIVSRSPRPQATPYGWIAGGIDALLADPNLIARADMLCQFASTTFPATSSLDPVADVTENLIPNIQLLEAMRGMGASRILYLSSGGAVYGRPERNPIPEMHTQRPISSYGIVKGAVERYLGMHAELHGLQTTIIRPANPYGPGQSAARQQGVIAALLAAARDDREAVIYGDGSIIRDFIYLDDLCGLLLTALESGATGVFNAGSGQGASLNEVIDTVESVTGRKIRRKTLPVREFDPPAIVLDIGRARDQLGWSPSVPLKEGIARTWATFA